MLPLHERRACPIDLVLVCAAVQGPKHPKLQPLIAGMPVIDPQHLASPFSAQHADAVADTQPIHSDTQADQSRAHSSACDSAPDMHASDGLGTGEGLHTFSSSSNSSGSSQEARSQQQQQQQPAQPPTRAAGGVRPGAPAADCVADGMLTDTLLDDVLGHFDGSMAPGAYVCVSACMCACTSALAPLQAAGAQWEVNRGSLGHVPCLSQSAHVSPAPVHLENIA